MKITIGGWFKLPRMGTAVFSALMKEGVRYDRESGFMLGSETDIESAVRTIGSTISRRPTREMPAPCCQGRRRREPDDS